MSAETQLHYRLEDLRTRLLVMCAAAEEALEKACEALSHNDRALAEAVVGQDARIDEMENEIDEAVLSILAREQPVARDLRFVASALRMVTDLERIGDEAAAVAERALLMEEAPRPSEFALLEKMMKSARRLLHAAVTAFRTADTKAALMICRGEDEFTQMEVHLLQKLMDSLPCEKEEDGGAHRRAMHLILIARSLNRVLRRSANIAEHTYFMIEGVNIRHKKV